MNVSQTYLNSSLWCPLSVILPARLGCKTRLRKMLRTNALSPATSPNCLWGGNFFFFVSKWVTKLSTTVFWQYGREQRAPLMKWSWRSPGRFPVTADGRSATERRCCCQGGCPSSLSPSPIRRPSLPLSLPPSLCYYKAIYTRDSWTSHQGLFLSHRCEDPHQLTRTEPIRSKPTDMGRFNVTIIQSNIIMIHIISPILIKLFLNHIFIENVLYL